MGAQDLRRAGFRSLAVRGLAELKQGGLDQDGRFLRRGIQCFAQGGNQQAIMGNPRPAPGSFGDAAVGRRRDFADADPGAVKLAYPARSQGGQGMGRGRVDRFRGDKLGCFMGSRIVDDKAAASLTAQHGRNGLDTVQGAFDIDLHGQIKFPVADIQRGQLQRPVDRVNEAVNASELVFDLTHHGFRLRPVGHVGRQWENALFPDLLLNLSRQRLDPKNAAAGDGDHASAFHLSQTPRCSVPDPAGSAGDNHHPSRQHSVRAECLHRTIVGSLPCRLKGEICYNNGKDKNTLSEDIMAEVAILSSDGAVTAGSAAWRNFLESGPLAGEAAAGIRAVLAGETPLFLLEYAGPASEARRWYNLRVTRFPGDGPVQAVALQEDVTARKQAEEALRQRIEELDQFAYVTSHDLKAPLRGIANLSRWIEEDLQEDISPEVAGQFNLLRGRVNRMEAMIDGILQYSRIDRSELPMETVDVKALLMDVIDLLSPPPSIAISMDEDLPVLQTPRLRLHQVFQNLLSNAIKHHDKPHGKIHVGVRSRGDWVEFSVADDGPGIAPKFQERIWVIFQTLEARDKVDNTGVGLALVKKIVEGQGGVVSVESQEGQGAVFRFTWPKI